jgi:hypothetical protein
MFTILTNLDVLGYIVAGITLLLAWMMRIVPFGMQVIGEEAIESLSEEQLKNGDITRPDGADKDEQGAGAGAGAGTGTGAGAGGGEETAEEKVSQNKKVADVTAGNAGVGSDAGEGGGVGGDKMFADKFKTPEDLAKGLLEIAKPLKYNAEFVQTALDLARETGKWDVVEKMYKQLFTALSANEKAAIASSAQQAGAGAGADPGKDTQQPVTQAGQQMSTEQTVALYALQETERAVLSSKVVRDLARAGYELPENFLRDPKVTSEFMDMLKEEKLSIEWMQLNNLISKTWRQAKQEASAYLEAEEKSREHNETMRNAEVKRIKEYANKIGLKVEDAELEAFLKEAENDPLAIEFKNEVAYLRENGLFNAWKMRNFDAITKQLELTAEMRGRTQAAEDLRKLSENAANGSRPSTAGLGAGRQEAPKVNLDNPDEVESLADDELFGIRK